MYVCTSLMNVRLREIMRPAEGVDRPLPVPYYGADYSLWMLMLVTVVHHPPPAVTDTEELPTLDSYPKTKKPSPELTPAPGAPGEPDDSQNPAGVPAAGGAAELQAEASQQGAFNEETGEINWDCPCLGGMADGPCGPEFKEAFSCFVFSQEEPKGVDCIEKFKGMQDCFRRHPDVYGSELEDDEGEYPEEEGEPAAAAVASDGEAKSATPSTDKKEVLTGAVEATDQAKAPISKPAEAAKSEEAAPKDEKK